MGDGGGGPGFDESVYSGTGGAIYQSGSAGAQAKLNDWQKVNRYGQISRANRDSYLKAYDAGDPKGAEQFLGTAGGAGSQTFDYLTIKNANAYEDQLMGLVDSAKKSEESAAKIQQAQSNAQRDIDLKRAQAIGGTQNNGVVSRGSSSSALPGASTILSAPLGVPGGYAATGKSILGA